jgi:hypothetical protein
MQCHVSRLFKWNSFGGGFGRRVIGPCVRWGGHPVVKPGDRSSLQRTPWIAAGGTAHHGLDICDLTFKIFAISVNTVLLWGSPKMSIRTSRESNLDASEGHHYIAQQFLSSCGQQHNLCGKWYWSISHAVLIWMKMSGPHWSIGANSSSECSLQTGSISWCIIRLLLVPRVGPFLTT